MYEFFLKIIASAHAQELIPCPDGTYADPTIGCVETPGSAISAEANIAEILLKLAGTLMGIVAVIATLGLIYGGIQYAIATGIEEKIHKAKRTILWSSIGLAVAIIARFATQFILGTIT